jgi:hypothetical protein
MDVGFLILSPDRNVAGLKNTVGSIKLRCYDRDYICVVGSDATAKDVKEMKQYCPTYKGQDTITSLVNVGMKKIKNDWACIVFGGSRVPSCIEKKWQSFCKKETDVLFPVVEGKNNFVDGCFNGVLINVKFFQQVGDFPANVMQKHGMNDFEFAKLLWASEALSNGVLFKGIIGMRVI